MSGLDSAESKGDWIYERKYHLGDRVVIVALGKKDVSAQKRFQFYALQEQMQEIDASEVSDVPPREGNFEIFGTKGHLNVT